MVNLGFNMNLGLGLDKGGGVYLISQPHTPELQFFVDASLDPTSELELDLIVPSNWLRWVNRGTTFIFSVDELGQEYKARVTRLGAKVDAVSQTIKLTGSFVVRPQSVLAGMSGTATFAPPTN